MDIRARLRNRIKERREAGKSGAVAYLGLPEDCVKFSPKKGTYYLDVIPYQVTIKNNPYAVVGDWDYQRLFHTHKGVGPNQETILCPTSFGLPCPICEQVAVLKGDWDRNKELIKLLSRKDRVLLNVIDLKKNPEVILVYEVSKYVFTTALENEIFNGDPNDDLGYRDFADFEFGSTLMIRFGEKDGGKGTYLGIEKLDITKRSESYDPSVGETAFDLDLLLKTKTYDEVDNLFNGVSSADIDTGDKVDEDTAPSQRVRKIKRGSSPAPDPTPDPEPVTPPVEEAPVKQKRTRKPKTEDKPNPVPPAIPNGHTVCIACGGTGKSSIGHACRPCRGEGFLALPPAVEDDPPKEDELVCPNGRTFGEEDNVAECEKCDQILWEKCVDLRKSRE